MGHSELRKQITETLRQALHPEWEVEMYGEAADVVTALLELFDIFAGGQ